MPITHVLVFIFSNCVDKTFQTLATAPEIVSFVANDPMNKDNVISEGDTLTVTFSKPVRQSDTMGITCSPSVTALALSGSWITSKQWQANITSLVGAGDVAVGSLTCVLNDDSIVSEEVNSEPASGLFVLTGSFGTKMTTVSISLPGLTECSKSDQCYVFPTLSNITASPTKTMVVKVKGNSGLFALTGIASAYIVTFQGTFDEIAVRLAYGVRVLYPSSQTEDVTFTVSVGEDASSMLTAVGIVRPVPQEVAPVLSNGETLPLSSYGGFGLASLSIHDANSANEYSVMAQSRTATFALPSATKCPTIRGKSSGQVLAVKTDLSGVMCLFEYTFVKPIDSNVPPESADLSVTIVDEAVKASQTVAFDVVVECHANTDDLFVERAKINSASTIIIMLSQPVMSDKPNTKVPVLLVFDFDSAELLGLNSVVVVRNSTTLEILCTSWAIFLAGNTLTFKGGAFHVCREGKEAHELTGTVLIEPPCAPIYPKIQISGPKVVSFCSDGLRIVAAVSNLGGRDSVVKWSSLDDVVANSIIQGHVLTIPQTALKPGQEYTIVASVLNYLEHSATQSFTFSVEAPSVPTVSVPQSGLRYLSGSTTFHAFVTVSKCLVGDDRVVTYSWAASCPNMLDGQATDKPRIVAAASKMPWDTNCTISITVAMKSNPSLASTFSFDIERQPTPPNAEIVGGASRMVAQSSALEVSASEAEAADAESVTWQCVSVLSNMPCTNRSGGVLELNASERLSFEAFSLPVGQIKFTLTLSRSLALSSTEQVITILPVYVPAVTLISPHVPYGAHPSGSIIVFTEVQTEYHSSLSFQWSTDSIDLTAHTNDTTSPSFVLQGPFIAGATVTVSCYVQDEAGSSTTSINVPIRTPPTDGQVLVSADSVTAVTETIRLTANGWTSDSVGGAVLFIVYSYWCFH